MKIVSAIKWAMKGDAISSTYTQQQQIAEYGRGRLWKIYQGVTIASNQKVAIFVLLKSSLKIYPKENRLYYISLMAKSIDTLKAQDHPSIIKIITPFTETKDSYCFITEPVIGTLESLMTTKRLKQMIVEEKLKYGIYSLAKGLQHLHASNIFLQFLNPSEILITPAIRWKIGGALFATVPKNSSLNIVTYCSECASILKIPYGYVAPENLVKEGSACGSGDIFWLGSTMITVFNFYRSETESNMLVTNTLEQFESALNQLNSSNNADLRAVPSQIFSLVKRCLHVDKYGRATAEDIVGNSYFHTEDTKIMISIDAMPRMTIGERKKFLLSLQNIFTTISIETVATFVIPALLKHLYEGDLTVVCLKNLIQTTQNPELQNYPNLHYARLKFLVDSPDFEVIALVIEHYEQLNKLPEIMLSANYVKLISKALESDHARCHKLAIDSISMKLDGESADFVPFFAPIVPSVGRLLSNNSVEIRVHANALISLIKFVGMIDYRKVEQLIYPIIYSVSNTHVAFMMGLLGLVQAIHLYHKSKLDSTALLCKMIPVLMKMSLHPNFNQKQLNNFKKTIFELMNTAFDELTLIRPRTNEEDTPNSDANSLKPTSPVASSNPELKSPKRPSTRPKIQKDNPASIFCAPPSTSRDPFVPFSPSTPSEPMNPFFIPQNADRNTNTTQLLNAFSTPKSTEVTVAKPSIPFDPFEVVNESPQRSEQPIRRPTTHYPPNKPAQPSPFASEYQFNRNPFSASSVQPSNSTAVPHSFFDNLPTTENHQNYNFPNVPTANQISTSEGNRGMFQSAQTPTHTYPNYNVSSSPINQNQDFPFNQTTQNTNIFSSQTTQNTNTFSSQTTQNSNAFSNQGGQNTNIFSNQAGQNTDIFSYQPPKNRNNSVFESQNNPFNKHSNPDFPF